MNNYGTQIRIVVRSMKSQIAAALRNILLTNSRLKYVEYDKIKLTSADFADYELPAVQIIDLQETVVHEQSRKKAAWLLVLEIIMKPTELDSVSQEDMWNMIHEIERKLWANPQLGVSGVIQLRYIGNQTDLHLLAPFYTGRIDVEVSYYEHLVRVC